MACVRKQQRPRWGGRLRRQLAGSGRVCRAYCATEHTAPPSAAVASAPYARSLWPQHPAPAHGAQVTLSQRNLPANKARKFVKHVCLPASGRASTVPHPLEAPEALLHAPSPSGARTHCLPRCLPCALAAWGRRAPLHAVVPDGATAAHACWQCHNANQHTRLQHVPPWPALACRLARGRIQGRAGGHADGAAGEGAWCSSSRTEQRCPHCCYHLTIIITPRLFQVWSSGQCSTELHVPPTLHGPLVADNYFAAGAAWAPGEAAVAYTAEVRTVLCCVCCAVCAARVPGQRLAMHQAGARCGLNGGPLQLQRFRLRFRHAAAPASCKCTQHLGTQRRRALQGRRVPGSPRASPAGCPVREDTRVGGARGSKGRG